MQPTTLLEWLLSRYPAAKRQTFKHMLEAGRVRINGRRASRLKQEISADDRIEIAPRNAAPGPPAERSPHRKSSDAIAVVYEDEDVLVVDKPAGLLTSTGPREKRPTLLAKVRDHVSGNRPRVQIGLIHRLDRDASGLLIFSKNDAAYRSLKTQFFHHTVTREYRAVVHGSPKPPAGRIQSMLHERADGTVHSTRQAGKGQTAVTDYEVLKTEGKLSLVRVVLRTGRKHQIRVHLSERGNPIAGDTVYGSPDGVARLMLAATRLTISHPRTGNELVFTLPPPKAFPVPDA